MVQERNKLLPGVTGAKVASAPFEAIALSDRLPAPTSALIILAFSALLWSILGATARMLDWF
jgi:hypothetical protein